MPDRDGTRPAFPLVLPGPFGFEDAVRRGRRLRMRRTATTGAGVLTVAGVVGALLLSQSGTPDHRLKVNDRGAPRVDGPPAPTRDATTVALPSPSAVTASPLPAPPRPDRDTTHGPLPGFVRLDPARSPTPAAIATEPEPTPVGKPRMRQTWRDAPDACSPLDNPAEDGWCTSADVTGSGAGRTLTFSVCREVGTSGELRFDSGREADFIVRDGAGGTVWQWSLGQRFGAARAPLAVPPGRCADWSTEWTGVAESGRKPRPGSYTLRAWSFADALERRAPEERAFEL